MTIRSKDYVWVVVLGVAALLFLNILVQVGLRPRKVILPEVAETKSSPIKKAESTVAAQVPQAQKIAFAPKLELLGTILGNPSVAFVYDPATDRSGLYKKNDSIGDLKVVKIESGKIVVEKDGSQCEVFLTRKSTQLAKENNSGIVLDESGTMVISKFQVMTEMMKANELLAKVKIQPLPDAETNKLRGFRIDNVPSGSIIEAAGIHDGDVICSVQGQQLASMQDALRMFNKVQNQSRIEVTLLRGEKPITLKYEIKN